MRVLSRGRALASLTATLGLALGTASVVGGAPSQADSGTCDTAYPVSELTDGQDVTGLTVTQHTTPTGFTGDVLGVLKDGIEPGVDMIMVRLSSPEIDRVGGIWQGMSGSPVYAGDGRLIGAVAYGLSWGPSPVAGVTPWEDMQKYAGTPPTTIRVGDKAARAIAASTDVTASQAGEGFTELKVPLGVAGVGHRALTMRHRPYVNRHAYTAGVANGADAPGPSDIVAGGNLAATMSTGDITMGGVGTVTSVCGGRVVGFGHPMNFTGATTMGLAGADAIYIQEDSLGAAFKLANIGAVLGTIDQDRMTGISGPLGTTPPSLPIDSTVTMGDDSRDGHTDVQAPEAAAAATFYELVGNHQSVMDAYTGGTDVQSWTVTGHTADGPFSFTGGNTYVDSQDVTFRSVWDVPDLVWLLSGVPGVTIDSVQADDAVSADKTVYHLKGVEQKRSGSWHAVEKGAPAIAHVGKTLKLRAVVNAGGTTKYLPFSYDVPASAAGARGNGYITQAPSWQFERSRPRTLAGVQKLVDHYVRNDQLSSQMYLFTKKKFIRQSTVTDSLDQVIVGRDGFRIRVK